MDIEATNTTPPVNYCKLGKSAEDTRRLRRFWRLGIILFSFGMIGVSMVLRSLGTIDGTVSAEKISANVGLFVFGIMGVLAGLLLPLSAFMHVAGFELSGTEVVFHHFDGKSEAIPYDDISRVVVAYGGLHFQPYSYDKLNLIIFLRQGDAKAMICGRCKGETVEQYAEMLRTRIKGRSVGCIEDDRTFRKEQTTERASVSMVWVCLVFFLVFWGFHTYLQYQSIALYKHGARAIAMVTDISKEGNRIYVRYSFTDSKWSQSL